MKNKFFEKFYDFFRYDIWKFIGNIYKFRKELYYFRSWDYTYNLKIFKRSLELTCDNIDKRGNEVDESRLKKVNMMRRVIQLMQDEIDYNYIEKAEKELGVEYKLGRSVLDDSDLTDKEKEDNDKIFELSYKLEKEQWEELWGILKGEDYEKDVDYNGSNMRAWWD